MEKKHKLEKARLTLNDQTYMDGHLLGAPISSSGELVFTTAMVGYHESLTDPSFLGQILLFSYPLIGNYGVPELVDKMDLFKSKGMESSKIQVAGIIMAVDSSHAFHWSQFESLDNWLKREGVPAIIGLDTRSLVKKIRQSDQLLAKITPQSGGMTFRQIHEDIIFNESSFFDPTQYPLMELASIKKPKLYGAHKNRAKGIKVAIIDCGCKWSIIRSLTTLGLDVLLVPYNWDLQKVDCSGWIISNGPGDPSQAYELSQRIKDLFKEDKPILGICMGNQLIAMAAGAKVKKLEHGHRGHNQPVYLAGTERSFMTSQNHAYVVDKDTLPSDWQVWFYNGNDQSLEGIRHGFKNIKGVQFHPEAAAGPWDTKWIFEDFANDVEDAK